MDDKIIDLSASIADSVRQNYEVPDPQRQLLNLSEISRDITAKTRSQGFTGLFDPRLVRYLEEGGVFFQPYRRVISRRSIVSAFIGPIVYEESADHDYFVATTDREFKGSDFYDSVTGENPTVVKLLEQRVLVDMDNVKKAYGLLNPHGDLNHLAKAYVAELINIGSIGEDDETFRLKKALVENKNQ